MWYWPGEKLCNQSLAWDGLYPRARVDSTPQWAPGWPVDCEKAQKTNAGNKYTSSGTNKLVCDFETWGLESAQTNKNKD